MANSKLVLSLRTLSPEEWVLYNRYLKVQTRRESESYKCFKAISNQREKLHSLDIEDRIKQKHFPKLTPKAFSNILSRLFGHFETWLSEYEFTKDKYAIELQLIKAYNDKGLFKLANQQAKKLEKRIRAEQYLDIDQNKALAQLYHSQYYSSNPIKKEKNSNLFDNCLLYFRKTTKENALGYLNELTNRWQIKRTKNEKLEKELLQIIKLLPDTPFSAILKDGNKLLKDTDLEAYKRIEAILNDKIIDPASDWYLILSIYYRRQTLHLIRLESIPAEAVVEAYEFAFLASEKNRHQKFLPMQLFDAIDSMAIFLSYEKVENFLNRWLSAVHTDYRSSVLAYSKALIAFRQDEFDKVPQLLNGLNFDNPSYKIQSNILLIIAQFELGEESLTHSLLENFRKRLKRNRVHISAPNYPRIENLISIIALMLKAKYDKSIEIDLSKYNGIYYRSWVMKKLKEQ